MLIRGAEVAGQPVDVRCEAGRVTEIGARLAPRSGEETIEAAGGALIAGLHDHHLHLFSLAASLASIDCGPPRVADAAALSRALHTAGAGGAAQGWRRGTGYFESVAGDLDRHVLDALGGDGPLRIQHRSGIAWFLNSAAIAALELDSSDARDRARASASDPALPIVERDGAGRATGRLYRADAWLREHLPASAPPDLAAAAALLARFGITGFTDATASNDFAQAEHLRAAQADGRIAQRIELMGDGSLATCASSERFVVGAHKFLLDEPALPALDRLVADIAAAHARGRGCAFHCVTRSEILFALIALESAGAGPGDRIEHASIAPPEAIAKAKRMGLTIVTQPNFVFERGDDYLREVAADERDDLYRVRSWSEAGVALAAGSDAPYGDPDPWLALRAAVDRRTRRGDRLGGSEAIPPEAALALFAPGAARRRAPLPVDGSATERESAASAGRATGFRVGDPADLCLLVEPWRVVREELTSECVAATICDGRPIYRRDARG